ncbi:MAG: efflux RND transporter permease subunit, partial [Cyclobacteriaceae bacterium]|nr:efflux RND transporter permease subunit [Cyclobacteriaceae bacterium]
MINRIIAFFLENRLVTLLLVLFLIFWGLVTIPFSWDTGGLARDPVPVDAIPDIGENQQIVFTEWMGKSPQDIDDQITYPLTTALMGIPGVKTIRSSSVFGFSSIYLVFDEEIEFYWSRARIVEKLNSLPSGLLPDDVQPALGPDATALGQIFWYTLEGRDRDGNPTGGWDPHELRSIQDFYLKYGLSAAQGVSEVASIGGYVQEYQVDIDPVAMKSRNVTVEQIMKAVQTGNRDTGARTIEFNRAEYLVRGLGFIKSVEDLKETVVVSPNNTPVYLRDVAHIQLGPAPRRGGLDKAGTEAVGAVVVARYGANPMEVIGHVKAKIKELEPGLPVKVLADGTYSKVSIVPFYDRTGLINETLGTLEEALSLEILISMIVVILLVMNVRASLLISSLLPLGVLITFIVMRYTGVSANIVALSGIAIAIGVMVDVGIVFTENIIRHLELPQNKRTGPGEKQRIIYEAVTEVSSAVITALATTVISFIPVFALQAQEGKLFQPLAYTKTFALLAALLVGLVVIPAFAYFLYSLPEGKERTRRIMHIGMVILGAAVVFSVPWAGVVLISIGANYLLRHWWPAGWEQVPVYFPVGVLVGTATYFLTRVWLPMGAGYSLLSNFMFVALIVGSILGGLLVVVHYYTRILGWCLANKWLFLSIPLFILFVGLLTWQGINKTLGFVPSMAARIHLNLYQTPVWKGLESAFPGMGKEFMPPLDEGSFLLMPTTMPHSGVEENLETIRMLDQRVMAIPEVELSVGKWGRAASALDPAPISMFENIIQYKSEYLLDPKGHRMRFKVNEAGEFAHKDGSFLPAEEARMYAKPQHLVTDPAGQYLRQWREHIHSPDDIWEEVLAVTQFPGMTSAPKLQPIATRLIMLSTGMRAPMGMKIYGPDLPTIEQVGFQMEKWLQEVPGVRRESVFADRVVGKPYIE